LSNEEVVDIRIVLSCCVQAWAEENGLEEYISSFDYAARKEMKIESKGLI